MRFRGDHVATTPLNTDRNRASLPQARLARQGDAFTALHSRSPPPRIYGFFQTRPHGKAIAPNRNQPPTSRPVNPGPRPCLIDVGFPLSRPRYKTSTSRSQRHARHTRSTSPYGLGSASNRARHTSRSVRPRPHTEDRTEPSSSTTAIPARGWTVPRLTGCATRPKRVRWTRSRACARIASRASTPTRC